MALQVSNLSVEEATRVLRDQGYTAVLPPAPEKVAPPPTAPLPVPLPLATAPPPPKSLSEATYQRNQNIYKVGGVVRAGRVRRGRQGA